MTGLPKVLILTPVKSASAHLPRYVELIEGLDWPRARLTLGILEGDSVDDTVEQLTEIKPRLEQRCARVSVVHHDYGFAAPQLADVTNREDWAACESVQRGAESPHFRPGPLAPAEDAVYQWVTMIARGYLGKSLA